MTFPTSVTPRNASESDVVILLKQLLEVSLSSLKEERIGLVWPPDYGSCPLENLIRITRGLWHIRGVIAQHLMSQDFGVDDAMC